VEDDGCGFDIATASLSDLVRRHHFGLVGMHEWARLAYGRLTLQPRLGGGTRVLLIVPLHQAAVLPAGAPAVTLLSLPHPQEI
jgi:signal transduction histidine kinase